MIKYAKFRPVFLGLFAGVFASTAQADVPVLVGLMQYCTAAVFAENGRVKPRPSGVKARRKSAMYQSSDRSIGMTFGHEPSSAVPGFKCRILTEKKADVLEAANQFITLASTDHKVEVFYNDTRTAASGLICSKGHIASFSLNLSVPFPGAGSFMVLPAEKKAGSC